MDDPDTTLSYSMARAPLSPSFASVCLSLALLPVVAIPFASVGRELSLAAAIILFGTLFSPVNAGLAIILVARYKGQPGPRMLSIFAAIIAGLNAGMLLLAIAGIAIHGMPC